MNQKLISILTNSMIKYKKVILEQKDKLTVNGELNITSNVGIGTSSPSSKLEVSSSDFNFVKFKRTTAGGGTYLDLENGDGDLSKIELDGSGQFFLKHTPVGGTVSTQFTVTQSGDVLIGTSTPIEKLTVAGAIYSSTTNGKWFTYVFPSSNVGTATTIDLTSYLSVNKTYKLKVTNYYDTSGTYPQAYYEGFIRVDGSSSTTLTESVMLNGHSVVCQLQNYKPTLSNRTLTIKNTNGYNGGSCYKISLEALA